MKALVISKLGNPEEALTVADVPEPVAAPGQQMVEVEAGGVNFADLMTVKGGYAGTPKPPLVAGREFSGMVGTNRVMGYTQYGAFADKVAARSQLLWPVPEGWSAEEGAAFPVNYFTAYFAYWKAGLIKTTAGDVPSYISTKPGRAGSQPRVLIHAVAVGVVSDAVHS